MMHRRLLAASIFAFLHIGAGLAAQTGDDALRRASALYGEGSFEAAFSLIAETIPENSPDKALRVRAADVLAGFALAEYESENWKNAYDGFRKALKYDPANSRATQYFLQIRKEHDVSSLTNDGDSATRPSASRRPASSAKPSSGGLETSGGQLRAMEEELRLASERLAAMEGSVNSKSSENEALRSQVERQLGLIDKIFDAQSGQNSSSGSRTAEEQAIMAQTMKILTQLAEREPARIVVESDPAVKELVLGMHDRQESLESKSFFTSVLLIILLSAGVLLLASLAIVISVSIRSRRRREGRGLAGMGIQGQQLGSVAGFGVNEGSLISDQGSAGGTPLLEFMQSGEQNQTRAGDAPIQRDLLRAEHLKRMYDEIRTGALSWDTLRKYIGELEVAIRADILKTVERKIDEGDILTPEAVFPVIFPFLTDYDDFLREKAEMLVKRSLMEEGRKSIGGPADAGDEGPFGLKALMSIPRDLEPVLGQNNQTLMTAKLCRGVGKQLGMGTEECNLLFCAALAHDCGYLMLDRDRLKAIISKPEISEEEHSYIMSHTVLGPSYFGEMEIPEEIKEAIIHHHERNDGSGYPDGLKKEGIHKFPKIIGTCETFAALVSKRAYREKRDINSALSILADGARRKFDADIVEALSKVAVSAGGF